MAKILFIYTSKEGQTERIVQSLAARGREAGFDVDFLNSPAKGTPLPPMDAAVVAGSIHVGKHDKRLAGFIKSHAGQLKTRPNLFLSVSLAIGSRNENEKQAVRKIAETFCEEAGWQPDRMEHVAGGVHMNRYNWLTRMVMRRILRKEGVDLPPSGELEFTDWAALQAAFGEFLSRVETAAS